MKLPIFLLCLAAVSCRQVPENEFRIEGRLRGVKDGAVITLFTSDGNSATTLAADTLKGGRFSFALPLTEKVDLSLAGPYDNPDFPVTGRVIWAAPGEKATVRGDNTLLYTWKVKSRVPEQKETDRYMLRSEAEYNLKQEILIEKMNLFKLKIHTPEAGLGKLRSSLDSLDRIDHDLSVAIYRNDMEVMNQTEVSQVWLAKLLKISRDLKFIKEHAEIRTDAEKLYEKLTPEQKELPAACEIRLNLFPPPQVEIGGMMADAELKDPGGNFHRLSDYLGKYILLDFWSSGCGQCRMAMGELRSMAEKYKDDLTIIGISLDTAESSWRKEIEEIGPTWLALNAPQGNDIRGLYEIIDGIPHRVIISPDGIILDSWSGYEKGLAETKLLEHLGK